MNSKLRLGVNIDHVATLRQARGTRYPDPLQAAFLAEQAGADGITVHLREDRRHIQDYDLSAVRKASRLPINLEMALDAGIVRIALAFKPYQICLVPEKRKELTTEGGLDVISKQKELARVIPLFREKKIKVSLILGAILSITFFHYVIQVNIGEIQYLYFTLVSVLLPLASAVAVAIGEGNGARLPNPIAANSFQEFVKKVLDVILQIGVPVAALALIYSGFLFVKARGNADELTKAKDTFLWTVIGVAILLGAWVLATVIKGTIDALA